MHQSIASLLDMQKGLERQLISQSTGCSSSSPGFGSQHLLLQLQGIWCPLLAPSHTAPMWYSYRQAKIIKQQSIHITDRPKRQGQCLVDKVKHGQGQWLKQGVPQSMREGWGLKRGDLGPVLFLTLIIPVANWVSQVLSLCRRTEPHKVSIRLYFLQPIKRTLFYAYGYFVFM